MTRTIGSLDASARQANGQRTGQRGRQRGEVGKRRGGRGAAERDRGTLKSGHHDPGEAVAAAGDDAVSAAKAVPVGEGVPGADGAFGEAVAARASRSERPQPEGGRILDDKLRIPTPNFPVLRRRRVLELLDQAVRRRVTLVSAPAGAGKTVACAAWAAAASERVVWLALDAEDRHDWFWAYVFAGIARARPAPAEVLRDLEDSSPQGFPLLLAEAAQSFTEPVVLIFDDLQDVADPDVLAGLDVLIRHAPPTLRLVLSARWPPPLQLARLRVSGDLADIGGADLACTPEEAEAYFDMLGIDVAADEREEVLRRTEGWMAGLRLAALRAEAAADGEAEVGVTVTRLAGDEPNVTDYLWDEVLARHTPTTRSFLLRTSVVPELSGDLADALTGEHGGGRTLERLSRENSFVKVLDRVRDGYRYHPLLRDVLVAELHRDAPQEIPALRRRAARWYAEQGRALEAARCAAQAQDWGHASHALAESGIGVVLASRPEEVDAVLALFPAHRAADDAAVCAAAAASRLWDGDPEGAAAQLDSARRALAASDPATRRHVEPTVTALRILHAADQQALDPGLVREGRMLAERLQPFASSQAEHRALGVLWLAVGLGGLNRWEAGAARDALRRADRHLGAGGLPELRARTRAWRALAEASCGDLAHAQRAADDVRTGVIPTAADTSCLATFAYAQVSLARDDIAGAQRLLGEIDACQVGHLPGEPPSATVTALLRARAWLADGDVAAARAVLSRLRGATSPARMPLAQVVTVTEAEAALRAGDRGRARALLLLAEDSAGPSRGDALLAQAWLLLAEGDFEAALAAVQPFLEPASALAGTSQERIRALLAAAVAHRRLGASEQSADLLELALELAEPEGAYRVFLDGGPAVRSAVTVLVPPTSRHASFAGRVLERFDAQGSRVAAPHRADVRLTDSERAVLCFLPSHMTNEEISQALFLSVNTVKTHLRSAYRKLGVGSRREAIAQGRRLGLLLSPGRGARWGGAGRRWSPAALGPLRWARCAGPAVLGPLCWAELSGPVRSPALS